MVKQAQATSNDMDTLSEDASALIAATDGVADEKVAEARKRLAAALDRGAEVHGGVPQKGRLIPQSVTAAGRGDADEQEMDIFKVSPVARAFPGQILLGGVAMGLGVLVATQAHRFSWPQWVALGPIALGVFLLLRLWIRLKSCSYRLTNQRLFVHHGWLARHVNELELYRVKDVVVDQGGLQRLLGCGTVTVLVDDATSPEVRLLNISSPTKVKEMIRTQYRSARRREGVRPTEFMQSPSVPVPVIRHPPSPEN